MPLETATVIEGLDQSWPLGGDPTNQGDDHLRLVKSVLKAQFPGVGGEGFNVAILATEAELNALAGLDTSTTLEVRLDAIEASVTALEDILNAPAGTRMTFAQASVPPGWTQDVAENDRMLRLVSGAGGGIAGTDSPIANDFLFAHVHGVNGTTSYVPQNHSHVYRGHVSQTFFQYSAGGGNAGVGVPVTADAVTDAVDLSHDHTFSAITDSAGQATGWRPKYVDIIIGIKD